MRQPRARIHSVRASGTMVQILLSTYNGARFLPPQLESLLAQQCQPIEILIRDDGSTDGTLNLLQEFATTHPNIRFVYGPNLGFVGSFLTLIGLSSTTADYVAYCDQDDVWRPDKLSRAVERLSRLPGDVPSLYCSRLELVNETLQPIGYSRLPPRPFSFRNALVECPLQGCSSVVNQATARLLRRELPLSALAHDWWTYLVVSAFGSVIYDEETRILYRQHSSNVFGLRRGLRKPFMIRLKRFLNDGKTRPVVRQAEEFQRIFEPLLSTRFKESLAGFVHPRRWWWERVIYAIRSDLYRQSFGGQLLLKFLMVSNRL